MAISSITPIYCAARSKQYAEIAIAAGFAYGAQLPAFVYHDPFFVDQDWKHPNREKYIAALAKYRPYMASVLDWEQPEQLSEVLGWAEDAAAYVERVLIVAKVPGQVHRLPRNIGGKQVVLAFSVATKFGGTNVLLPEFLGWPVHLLGGTPQKQMQLARHLNVVSIDGTYQQLKANGYCEVWFPGGRTGGRWKSLSSLGDDRQEGACYEAFRRSCENIMAAWRRLELGRHVA